MNNEYPITINKKKMKEKKRQLQLYQKSILKAKKAKKSI